MFIPVNPWPIAFLRVLCVLCGLYFAFAQQPSQVEVRPQRLPQDTGSAGLNQALKKLKTATTKNSEEMFFQGDMELHRTIWKAANQPLLYRTLNLVMNPYIFIIARSYSSRLALTTRRDNHELYVRMILKTPLDKIEEEVEHYFEGLYSKTFDRSFPFPALGNEHWSEEMEGSY